MKIGIVNAIDQAACRVRVQFQDADGMISDWLPVMQHKTLKDKFYFLPDLGEHVVCMMDENDEAGVVLGAIYSAADTPPANSPDLYHVTFSDGTVIEYDRSAHKLTADVKGSVELNATGTITSDSQGLTTIKASAGIVLQAPSINMASYSGGAGSGIINGTLRVTGDITGESEVRDSVRTMSGDRTIFNGHTHPGDSGGTTGQPNQNQ